MHQAQVEIKATLYVYLCIVMYFILEAINYYYYSFLAFGSSCPHWGQMGWVVLFSASNDFDADYNHK